LKVLKRAGLPPHHLLHYYVAVIRPVLEYCSCIWHHYITNKLSLQIEAIQKRAIKIIFECTRDMSYANSLYLTELSLLDPNSCLHSLLPTLRDPKSCYQTPSCPPISGTGFSNQKISVFYKFWPLKLPINLALGRPVVFLLF